MQKSRLGLRARIIAWSLVPTMIILGTVAATALYTFARVTESLVMNRNQTLTELVAGQISAELTRHVDTLNAFAMTSDLQGLDPAHVSTALRWSIASLRDFDGGVAVLDGQGVVIAVDSRRPELVGQNWKQRRFFQRLQTLDTVTFASDIEDLGPEGRPVIALCLPIRGPSHELAGVLVGLLELDTYRSNVLYRSLLKFHIRASESRLYLVDSSGLLIDPLRQHPVGQDVSERPTVQRALAGQAGALRTIDGSGRSVIASYAPVPDTPWALIEEEDWRALSETSRRYGRVLVALLLLGLVLPPVLVGAAMQRIIGPLSQMTAVAQEIARGTFDQRVEVPPGDELADLAEAFSEMAFRLQSLYANLETQVAERTQELATLNRIAAVVSGSLDLSHILQAALDATVSALDVSAGAVSFAPRDQEPQMVWRGLSAAQATEWLSPMAKLDDSNPSVAHAPLVAQGQQVGRVLLVAEPPRRFSTEERQLLGAIGQQMGVAATNARLYEQAETLAVTAERNRLARELHDSVTQMLFSANLIAGVLPLLWEVDQADGRARLDELQTLTQGALAEMRMLLLELRPSALTDAPLNDLLGQLRDAMGARARLPIDLRVSGGVSPPPEVRVVVYRVAQEALHNVIKHAHAHQVTMTLEQSSDAVRLTVGDDGRGFCPDAVTSDHLGLRIMRERMTALGGTLRVVSEPGLGTLLTAEWRLGQTEEAQNGED